MNTASRCSSCRHTVEDHEHDGWTCECSACPWKSGRVHAPAPVEALIRFYAMEPVTLTTVEYEALRKDVTLAAALGERSLGLSILARMLVENEPRYHEAKRANEERNR